MFTFLFSSFVDVAELSLLAGSSFIENENCEFSFPSSFLPVDSSLDKKPSKAFIFFSFASIIHT